ncbi:ATP-binding cassette domain-containing protein [Thermoactinospora rubra]|uniref:ATP-binding cassette domain-containing protein n=1 Tax=Thermoactinospora rubra TaxID=1088767 RepID=UPI000A10EB46|nr:ATP-binding cassette domain-containing protein [Thermoactinospora rubra]
MIIETGRLSRAFGERTVVDPLTFRVRRGEIFGLLGPNGAGKTTIRMPVTLPPPTSGAARVCGFEVTRAAQEVRRRVGYAMQQVSPMGTTCSPAGRRPRSRRPSTTSPSRATA